MADNLAVIASAGSRKTQQLVESALAIDTGRALITTYTIENQRQIRKRIESMVGITPPHISIVGWFSFLISQCAKPYQRALTEEPGIIQGLNFRTSPPRFAKKTDVTAHYLDRNHDMYRDRVSDFICQLHAATNGAVTARLERIYGHVFVDEVQDLVGYDLDVLDLLIESEVNVTVVGDPRQFTLSTSHGTRNKKYRGVGLVDWFQERSDRCQVEERTDNYRSNAEICEFANSIFPDLAPMSSASQEDDEQRGINLVSRKEAVDYYEAHRPTVLRDNKNADTLNLPAMNIGVSKGSTFDHVLIFPTKPMLKFVEDRNPAHLKAPERLYVAVTRARHSVAFVLPS